MKISIRDRRLIAAIKDSWKHTDLYIKLLIIGLLCICFSLIGYGMRYLIEKWIKNG